MAKQDTGVLARVRAIVLPIWLLAAAGIFLAVMHPHYPIQHWLFWRYASYWLSCGVFAVCCLGLGHAVVRRITGPRLPLLQHLSVAFPIGVFAFELLMFFVGLARLYQPWLFFAFPLVVLAATGPRLFKDARRWVTHLRAQRRRAPPTPAWKLLFPALGLLALAVLYFGILSPDNVQFDARWRHLAIPEDFVAFGGVRRFDEGWTGATGSHFHSFLYTWAWLFPGGLFDHIELSQHIEFTIFLYTTLITIPAMVRWIVPGADPRLVWAARFLYPGVFLNDSNISGNADHVAALFCAPLLFMTVRSLRDLEPRYLLIVSMILPSLVMGKETAMLMMAPMTIALVAGRAAQFAVQTARRRIAPRRVGNWWRGPAVAVAGCLVFGAPHWLCNLLWHGDPFYPILHKYFTPFPWTPDAAYMYSSFTEVQLWAPPRTLAGLWETLGAMVDFSFAPNDWKHHHGKVPVFGSLMTLLIPALLFLRGTRRVWFLAAWVHVGLFIWYWVHHQDRYLQTMVPWMTTITATTMILVWRQGGAAGRGALVVLVGAQVVWSGDIPFFTKKPIKRVVDLLAGGYDKAYEKRLNTQSSYAKIGKSLPAGARVLLHENHAHLGIGHSSVSDWTTWQYGLSYGLLDSPRAVFDALTELGVTHIHWPNSRSRAWDSVAADLMFYDFVYRRAVKPKKFGKTTLAEMPRKPPIGPEEFDDSVAVLGCGRGYPSGLYKVSDLQTKEFGPDKHTFAAPRTPASKRPTAAEVDKLIEKVAFVVVDPSCHAKDKPKVKAMFDHAASRTRVPKNSNVLYELYIRKLPQAARKSSPPPNPATAPPKPPGSEPAASAGAVPGAASSAPRPSTAQPSGPPPPSATQPSAPRE